MSASTPPVMPDFQGARRLAATPSRLDAILGGATPRLRGRTPIAAEQLVLSVLIPVYNERATIELIVDQVHQVPVRTEIICVDDCSTDGTRAILERLLAERRIDRLVL